MAPRKLSKIINGDLLYQRKRYTIAELLEMRCTLPYVCCPVKNFKPEAWSERILIETVIPLVLFVGPRSAVSYQTISITTTIFIY